MSFDDELISTLIEHMENTWKTPFEQGQTEAVSKLFKIGMPQIHPPILKSHEFMISHDFSAFSHSVSGEEVWGIHLRQSPKRLGQATSPVYRRLVG